jgi:hypothetical protein
VISRRVNWPSAIWRPAAHVFSTSIGPLCQAGGSPDDVIDVDCEWELGPVFSQTLLPLGRRGRHCVWVRFLAAVGQMETLTIKTLSAPLVVPQRNRPHDDSSRDT